MHQQSRKQQRWLALVGQGTADRQAVASDRLGFLVLARCYASLNLAHASRIFLELRLGMVVGLDDRFGSLFEIVELAELVRNTWERSGHGIADRLLPIRDHATNWHVYSLAHFSRHYLD